MPKRWTIIGGRRLDILAAEKIRIQPQPGGLGRGLGDIESVDFFGFFDIIQHIGMKANAISQHADIAMKLWHIAHIIAELMHSRFRNVLNAPFETQSADRQAAHPHSHASALWSW